MNKNYKENRNGEIFENLSIKFKDPRLANRLKCRERILLRLIILMRLAIKNIELRRRNL